MENLYRSNSSKPELTQISEEEREIINSIRKMNFGRIVISIQNGNIVNKEVTIITKNNKRKSHDYEELNSDVI